MAHKPVLCCVLGMLLGSHPLNVMATERGDNYLGLQYAQATYTESGLADFEPTALVGRLGHFSTDTFALEFRLGVGIDDDSQRYSDPWFGTFDFGLEIDTLIGFYGVGHIPISAHSSLYALFGYTQVEFTGTISDGVTSISGSADESDVSMGVGLSLGLGERAALTLEYISYLAKADFDLSATSLGFVMHY